MAGMTLEALTQQAREAIAERDWQKARAAYEQALTIQPNSADVHQGLATVCFQVRDLTSAAFHFKEVTRHDPHRAGAFINLGAVYNLLDQLDEAVAVLRRGIQLDATRAEGYYNLGLVYRRKNQIDLAIHAYKEAVRINPRMADAHYNLGNLYVEREMYQHGVECYRRALQVRPEWEKATQALAHALEAQEAAAPTSTEEAPDEAQPAVRPDVDPHRMIDPEAHANLLVALHRTTIEAENIGRDYFKLVEHDVEPVIKELSTFLITPDETLSTLDDCIKRFDDIMTRLNTAKESLLTHAQKVQKQGTDLVSRE